MSGKGENIIQSVRSSTLSEDETVDTHKRELSVVTSYNWLDRSEPTIMVPGEHLISCDQRTKNYIADPN